MFYLSVFKGKFISLDDFVQEKGKKYLLAFFKLLLLIPYISDLAGN